MYKQDDEQTEQRTTEIAVGRNPVAEMLRSDREVDSIYIQNGGGLRGPVLSIVAKAKEKGIPIKEVDVRKLDQLADGLIHQGIVAVAAAWHYTELEEILRLGGDAPFLVLADNIEDPYNLGAIIRTAECAGAHGVIIPKRHSVGLTAVVAKASAGAIEHMPVARVSNISATIEELKKRNIWVYCADMGGENWCSPDYRGAVALVIGSEGAGVSRLVKERCDATVSMPMLGKIGSLNASVAAGIVLFEICRQRGGIKALNK